ncbi:alpha-mannosidase [Clostridia bacterium]|nr:alpha-mannosidase [Clostridia bacterium]
MTLTEKYSYLKTRTGGVYFASRVTAEIGYALKLSAAEGGKYDDLIAPAVDFLIKETERDGVITKGTAAEAEKLLLPLSDIAKKTTVYCVSHAHIDMNWMWGLQETAATAIDTFRTVLNLMDEYPEFTFSQSQASCYKIVEEYDPDMLDEIKRRVDEGRWEVTASTWVETDKNMPNGESLARHILYTKRYLNEIFGLAPDRLQLDFEPDTFGHNLSIPEICAKGGVKYYYHCRGYEGHFIYNWKSPSGESLLVYREPFWYNAGIDYDMFFNLPQFLKEYDTDIMLKVYGVGNHGGGPTRRDVERIADMMTWPVMPTLVFGTYHDFFKKLEKNRDKFPTVEHELNYIFTGCYTSQSRIKLANRISEDRLYEAEAISAIASTLTGKSYAKSFRNAWEKVLFNHFHDILPGSGVIETREYALGEFQKVMTAANTNVNNAMRSIAAQIDTSAIQVEIDKEAGSEGGGVGFMTGHADAFKFPQTERGSGKTRIIHLFNPTAYKRHAPVDVMIWDYWYDKGSISIKDMDGNPAEFQIITNKGGFWGHDYMKIALSAEVPAFGYATYVLTEEPRGTLPLPLYGIDNSPRLQDVTDNDLTLENDKIRAVFSSETLELISLVEKHTGQEQILLPSAYLSLNTEGAAADMAGSAWTVGTFMNTVNLNEFSDVKLVGCGGGNLRKWIKYEFKFARSSAKVTISLDKGSPTLRFSLNIDWHEIGTKDRGIPQISFNVPLLGDISKYRYDIPFGWIDREPLRHDVPANSYAVALPDTTGGTPVMIVTDSKYGFRSVDDQINVTLIRASTDPDPYPEYGVHEIEIGLSVQDKISGRNFDKARAEFIHPIAVTAGTKHAGTLPGKNSFIKVTGRAVIAALKTAEDSKDGKTIIIRLHDADRINGEPVKLEFASKIVKASVVDINERATQDLVTDGKIVNVPIEANAVASIAVTLA